MAERAGFLQHRLVGDQQTLARPLRTLLRREPVICPEDLSVREVARIMHARSAGSVVVADRGSHPVGLFSADDLVAAAARGLDDQAVSAAMNTTLLTLPAHAMAYEAALAMMANHVRHVLVTDERGILGVVSEQELFSLHRLGLGEIITEIRVAGTIESLAEIASEIRKLARLLVEEGVAAEQLHLFVSVLNDRLCERIIELERKRHLWSQISWCWLAFGSEGRFEQTFSTDQDNGILFFAHDGASPDEARVRLLPFAGAVNAALAECGFPLCSGNVMASNPAWCLSMDEWKSRMLGWLECPEPQALLDASICFDFRPLYGDATLAIQLREWILPRTRSNPAFLRHLAETALKSRPPLGCLGRINTERGSDRPSTINLKLNGARLFEDCARVYALAHGLPPTNTAERLRAARAATGMDEGEVESMVGAFFFIQGLRLRNQAALPSPSGDSPNRIDPGRLNEMERQILKLAFRQARKLQSRLAMDYQV